MSASPHCQSRSGLSKPTCASCCSSGTGAPCNSRPQVRRCCRTPERCSALGRRPSRASPPSLLPEHATLAVGISTGLGRGLLPAVRVRLAESAPLARLQIRQVLWGDPTGGLAADDPGRTDAAFVWLPVPNPQLYEWLEVSIEPRLIALPATHPLAVREDLDITDVLDEPFLALPAESGALRDYWLANDFRDGRPPLVAAEIASTEETVEALTAGLGVCLVAAGNVPLIAREGVAIRQISGLTPARLALVWRRGDERPLLAHLRRAVRTVSTGGPQYRLPIAQSVRVDEPFCS